MQAMTVRGSPAVRYLAAAPAITIVVFVLKYSSDFLAHILFAATLAILFTPALWWPEKKGFPEWLFACHGECPKNRFLETPDGEPGLNYLCAGYKAFFHHVDKPMRIIAELLRRDRAPAEMMLVLASEKAQLQKAFAKAGRNDPCPCGSGYKFKQCHRR